MNEVGPSFGTKAESRFVLVETPKVTPIRKLHSGLSGSINEDGNREFIPRLFLLLQHHSFVSTKHALVILGGFSLLPCAPGVSSYSPKTYRFDRDLQLTP